MAFFAGQSVLAKVGLDTSFGQPGVARAVLGSAVYLAVAAVLGVGLGALLRNTAAAVTALFGLLFGLQLLAGLIPGATGVTLEKFMPSTAGQAIASVHPDPGTSLGPWAGPGPVRLLHDRGPGPGRPADEPRRRVTRSRGRTRAAAKGEGRPPHWGWPAFAVTGLAAGRSGRGRLAERRQEADHARVAVWAKLCMAAIGSRRSALGVMVQLSRSSLASGSWTGSSAGCLSSCWRGDSGPADRS